MFFFKNSKHMTLIPRQNNINNKQIWKSVLSVHGVPQLTIDTASYFLCSIVLQETNTSVFGLVKAQYSPEMNSSYYYILLSAFVALLAVYVSLPLLRPNAHSLSMPFNFAGWFSWRPPTADLVLRNAVIYTSNDSLPFADSMAVRNGRILRLGNYSYVKVGHFLSLFLCFLFGSTNAAPLRRVFVDWKCRLSTGWFCWMCKIYVNVWTFLVFELVSYFLDPE